MNPYTVIRRVLVAIGYVLKVLMLLLLVFLFGVIGVAITGGWWGWIVGPVGLLAAFLAYIVLLHGLIRLPDWWKGKERAYREKQRTAHVEGNPVTN